MYVREAKSRGADIRYSVTVKGKLTNAKLELRRLLCFVDTGEPFFLCYNVSVI